MTYGLAHTLFWYDPETGEIWHKRRPAKLATTMYSGGYEAVSVLENGRRVYYYAHRLAWLMHTGHWPVHELDHINGDRADNRIANLRDVLHKVSLNNRKDHRHTTADMSIAPLPKQPPTEPGRFGIGGLDYDKKYRAWKFIKYHKYDRATRGTWYTRLYDRYEDAARDLVRQLVILYGDDTATRLIDPAKVKYWASGDRRRG